MEGLGPISQALTGFSSWSEQDVVEEVEKFKEGNRMAGTAYSNWEKRAISQAKAAIKKFKKREEVMFGDMSYQRRQEKGAELPEDEDSLSDTDDLVLPFSVSQPTGNSELGEEESEEDSQVSLTEVAESVMPATETRRVSILDKFPHAKIRASRGTTTGIAGAREEVQHALVSGTPQARGTSPISPPVEAGTPEAEGSDKGDTDAATSGPISEPDLYSAEA